MTRATTRLAAYVRKTTVLAAVLGSGDALAQDATAIQLPEVAAQARPARAYDPTPGFVPALSAAGTKTDTPLLDTPQAVSVVTRDRIDAQLPVDTAAALRYSAGVLPEPYGNDTRYGWPRVRGFNLQNSQFLDGLRLPNGTYAIPQVELWGLQRLEIIRGPSSVLYGQIPPGGLLNYTSRRPPETETGEIRLQTGSFDRKEAAVDLGGPVAGTDGTLLYRFDGLVRDADTQVKEVRDRRVFAAPALTWRPNESTSVTLLSYYQRDDSGVIQFLPSQGTLRLNPYGRIPVDFFTGEKDANNFDRTQWGTGYQFEHRFNDSVTVRQNLRYSRIDFDMNVVRGFGLAADQRTLTRAGILIRDHADAFTVDNQVQAKVTTGPLAHTVLAGVDYRRGTSDYGLGRVAAPGLDIFNPVYGRPFALPTSFNSARSFTLQNQTGVYLQDQIRLGGWLLTLSGRHDWSTTDTSNMLANTQQTQVDRRFSGRVGLNYVFDFGLSPYVAYSTAFQPQVGITAAGAAFKPLTGEQVEVGIKYQPPNKSSFLTISAYDLRQQNVPTTDPSNTLFQLQSGEIRVRGIELEATAAVTRELSLIASYGYTDSKTTKSTVAAQVGKRVQQVPEHQAALYVDQTFRDGPLKGLGLAAGVRHISGAFGDTAEAFGIPASTQFDAAIRYDLGAISPKLERLQLAVNASNLSDEVSATCISAAECYYGARRLILGTVRYKW